MNRFCSTIDISFDSQIFGRNFSNFNAPERFEVSAKAPVVPRSVLNKVNRVKGRFREVMLVWEAEWEPAPVRDPLVIGVIYDKAFLLDQYDTTKLERYIVSEFTTREG
jgi:hypothetical protein